MCRDYLIVVPEIKDYYLGGQEEEKNEHDSKGKRKTFE